MAKAPEPAQKLSLSEMDKPTKIKLFGALAVLFVAIIWIIIWSGVLSGDPAKPTELSEAEKAKLVADNEAEKARIEAETPKAPPGRKPPKPSGS